MRHRQTALGDWLAGQLDRLAQLVRFSGASTPAEFEDRFEAMETEWRAAEYDRGHADALAGTFSAR